MPKNPNAHKQGFRNSGPPRSAADLLADISRRHGVTAGGSSMAGKAAGTAQPAAESAATKLRGLLPPELAPHLHEARVRDGLLIVYVDSAAWGARLRLSLMEHIGTSPAPLLPGLGPGAKVVARVMPAGGYRR